MAAASICLEISLAPTIDDASFAPARARLHTLIIARHISVLAVRPPTFKTVQAKARECSGDVGVGERVVRRGNEEAPGECAVDAADRCLRLPNMAGHFGRVGQQLL